MTLDEMRRRLDAWLTREIGPGPFEGWPDPVKPEAPSVPAWVEPLSPPNSKLPTYKVR